MGTNEFIEVDLYEEGRWITRRLPLEIAERLYHQLGLALGAPGHPQSQAGPEDRLKIFVD